jgi:hypothetical protein
VSKVKDKPDYEFNYPDPFEFEDEIDAGAVDVIHEIHTYLVGLQDTKPKPVDIMFELARRIAAREIEEGYDSMEKFLNPRKRARTKLEKAQAAADKWCATSSRKRSKREVAKHLAKKEYGSFDYLNKNLKIPS